MLFSTQLVKPNTPALNLNGTVITLCVKVKYLGITVDDKLRYQEHVQSVLTTVSQRMYIVKNFVYLSSKPLSNLLLKSFIVSLISYCLPILNTSIHASDKKCIRKGFKDAIKLGIEHPRIDALMTQQTKTLAMGYTHDEDHFINDFLNKCLSGAWGRDCFLRHLIHTLNSILY